MDFQGKLLKVSSFKFWKKQPDDIFKSILLILEHKFQMAFTLIGTNMFMYLVFMIPSKWHERRLSGFVGLS